MGRRDTLQLLNLERLIDDSQARITRQRNTVAELQRGGRDTRRAERLLATFIDLRAQHIQQRDKLRSALNQTLSPARTARR